jgi:hypothetical protein
MGKELLYLTGDISEKQSSQRYLQIIVSSKCCGYEIKTVPVI